MNKKDSFLMRLLRNSVSLGISILISYLCDDKRLILTSPVISAVAKYIRDITGIKKLPL